MTRSAAQPRFFAEELAFTGAYRQNIGQPAAIREAHCLAVQFPAIFSPIQACDLFAGRISRYPLVGFGMEQASGGPGYYCYEEEVREKMRSLPLTGQETADLEAMLGCGVFGRRSRPKTPHPIYCEFNANRYNS